MGILDLFKKKQNSTESQCSTCGEKHDELPALGFKTPFYYGTLNEMEKAQFANISKDFCVLTYEDQTDRFIRTVLTIPINDACEDLDYGVWVSLSEKSFNEYEADYNYNVAGKTYFGRLSNKIRDYEESTLELHVNVNTRNGGIRPETVLHKNEHKLVSDWENGITIEEAKKRVEGMKTTIQNKS